LKSSVLHLLNYSIQGAPKTSILYSSATPLPIYFSMQKTLPVLLALPAERHSIGTTPSGMAGVLDPSNRPNVLTPLALAFVMSALNLVFVGPGTTKMILEERFRRQGKARAMMQYRIVMRCKP